MPKREVLDEEPLDIDLGLDEEEQEIDLSEDTEEEDEPSSRKQVKGQALTDEDLDAFEEERKELRSRTEAAEAAAKEARDIAVGAVDRLEKTRSGDAKAQLDKQKQDVTKQIEAKRKALKAAFEEGDGDKHTQLTEEMADLKGQERILTMAEEQLKAQQTKQTQQQPRRPEPPQKAKDWLKKNQWFNENEEARISAVLKGNMLERAGVSPTSDEYYTEVDKHMKRRFPEIFETKERKTTQQQVVKGVDRDEGGERTRTTRRSNKVKLTSLQVRMAKQWNIPLEKMAQEVQNQQKREQETR